MSESEETKIVPLADPNGLGAGKASHLSLKAGDVDPELGKVILEIVQATNFFFVYVDEEMMVQWYTLEGHEMADHCGEVLNLVATLEAQSRFLIGGTRIQDFRRRIAEGLARCFDGSPKDNAFAVLREVSVELKIRNKEVSWLWYFQASYLVTLGFAIIFALTWLGRQWVQSKIGVEAFEIVLGAICGSFGALLFATARSGRLVLDANAGVRLHQLEGLSRIGAGVIGALFVALAIKSGLILGSANFGGNKFALLLCLCIVAGASERLVPSLISTFEKTISAEGRERKPAIRRVV